MIGTRGTTARACAGPADMPLSTVALEEMAAEFFAEDLEIPAEATRWSREEAERYFASGGTDLPHVDTSSNHALRQPEPQPAWWDARDGAPTLNISESSRFDKAHVDTVSRVCLFRDTAGAVTGCPGEVIAASSSWDCSIRLWRVADASGAATSGAAASLGELRHSLDRWVYSIACCGYLGGAGAGVGLVSTHSGGMVGEPEHLIRLWSITKAATATQADPSAAAASASNNRIVGDCVMLVNTEGALPAATPDPAASASGQQSGQYAHRRGVHALDYCNAAKLMATLSTELLVVWSLNASTGRFRESARAGSPLTPGSTPTGVRWLGEGTSLAPLGDFIDDAIPIFDAEPSGGLRAAQSLEFRGRASDLIELAGNGSGGGGNGCPVVAANRNRAFVYDRRAGPRPCARLPLPGIHALACMSSASPGAPPALLTAGESGIHVYDVRKLPEDTKLAKLPSALATLTQPRSTGATGGRRTVGSTVEPCWTGLAVLGSIVVASDWGYGLSVWDVAARSREHAPL